MAPRKYEAGNIGLRKLLLFARARDTRVLRPRPTTRTESLHLRRVKIPPFWNWYAGRMAALGDYDMAAPGCLLLEWHDRSGTPLYALRGKGMGAEGLRRLAEQARRRARAWSAHWPEGAYRRYRFQ